MIFVALKLIYDSVISLFNPKEISIPNLAIIVCIITITIKLIPFVYTSFLSKRTDSILIKALKQDHRNDCIVTTFTLISIILSMFGIYWFDGIVGIGISVLICITGIKLFIDSYNVLMDSSMDDETKQKILDIVKNYPFFFLFFFFFLKSVRYKYLFSISIYVDGNMSTFDSHQIADKLEKELNSLDSVYLSIIHVNPI